MADGPAIAPGDGAEVVLSVRELTRTFALGRGQHVHAVAGVSFDIFAGETLGLVGESGCGKTTVGRAIMQLPPQSSGEVILEGRPLAQLSAAELRASRGRLQMVFQDPISSLNPMRTIGEIVMTPLVVAGQHDRTARERLARETLEAVGLDPDAVWKRHPHELSGGQCQRVSIARALVLRPRLLICDEPVSSLDVSVQAQILNLLEDAKARFGLTMLFIAHDLAVVKNVSDRLAVMYLGRLCEVAPSGRFHEHAAHPYTATLLAAVPEARPQGKRQRNRMPKGEVSSPLNPPSGCRFRLRCPFTTERCAAEEPQLRPIAPGHLVACHFPLAGGSADAKP